MDSYEGDVRLIFKHFPLAGHAQASPAAQAGWAAHQQGKFWEMHDLMFANQKALGDADLSKYARSSASTSSSTDRQQRGQRKAVDADTTAGSKVGLSGTPYFLVNGHPYSGALPAKQWREIIELRAEGRAGLVDAGTARDAVYAALMKDAKATPRRRSKGPAEAPPRRARPGQDLPGPDRRARSTAPTTRSSPSSSSRTSSARSASGSTRHARPDQGAYAGDLRVVFRQRPLPMHPEAREGAKASLAAHRQGKFWEMHDKLFANPSRHDEGDLHGYAQELGLDTAMFELDLDSAEIVQMIKDDEATADRSAPAAPRRSSSTAASSPAPSRSRTLPPSSTRRRPRPRSWSTPAPRERRSTTRSWPAPRRSPDLDHGRPRRHRHRRRVSRPGRLPPRHGRAPDLHRRRRPPGVLLRRRPHARDHGPGRGRLSLPRARAARRPGPRIHGPGPQRRPGRPHRLRAASLVIVNFWATWCEPCIREWPQLDRLAERFAGRDEVVILAISVDTDPTLIAPFLERMSLSDTRVRVLWDPKQDVNKSYGTEKLPDTYFVGARRPAPARLHQRARLGPTRGLSVRRVDARRLSSTSGRPSASGLLLKPADDLRRQAGRGLAEPELEAAGEADVAAAIEPEVGDELRQVGDVRRDRGRGDHRVRARREHQRRDLHAGEARADAARW
jgi:protein-disulfide isomerase/thiol-disulfide isomerase/thioredoxin